MVVLVAVVWLGGGVWVNVDVAVDVNVLVAVVNVLVVLDALDVAVVEVLVRVVARLSEGTPAAPLGRATVTAVPVPLTVEASEPAAVAGRVDLVEVPTTNPMTSGIRTAAPSSNQRRRTDITCPAGPSFCECGAPSRSMSRRSLRPGSHSQLKPAVHTRGGAPA
jgi:hypothetical protein